MLIIILRYLKSLLSRKPVVIWHWRPHKPSLWQRIDKAVLAIQVYAASLYVVPALAAWIILTLYGTPHVLIEYAQNGTGQYGYRSHCTYVGIHGLLRHEINGCPLIALIEQGAQ